MDIQEPYIFVTHEVDSTPPQLDIYDEVKTAFLEGRELSRERKDELFDMLMNNSYGNGYYRILGWCFNFRQFMKKYLVKYSYDNSWMEICAFDPECIVISRYTNNVEDEESFIVRIVQLPDENLAENLL